MRFLSDETVEHLRQAADWPEPPGQRYTVLERIGRGGMGSVYRVHDRELDRCAAMKVLHHATASPAIAARMLREARIIARMEHPGIVPVHDVGQLSDGRLFYVMKEVRGRRLDEMMDGEAALTDRIRIHQRICETLAFAHARGVIHRDVKPQNIMVGEFGEVLVMDWGVARVLDPPEGGTDGPTTHAAPGPPEAGGDDAARTQAGAVLGTEHYMSPEQASGRAHDVDARSDVYSLGALLFFLLSGVSPGRAAGERGRADAPSLRMVIPSAPKPLDAICRKALDSDPAQRYATAAELREELDRFLSGGRVRAHREGLIERLERFFWKYRAAILLVVAYLLMRTAFAGYELWRLKDRGAALKGSSGPTKVQDDEERSAE